MIQLLTWIIGTFTGLGVLLAGLGYGYGQFKKGQREVDTETISSYERTLEAVNRELGMVKNSNAKLESDNKELHAQVNQLIGENKALRSVKPDTMFQTAVQAILTEQKNLREDFIKHAELDDKRFSNIGSLAEENNTMLKQLCGIDKK